jgi:hypothetical protein
MSFSAEIFLEGEVSRRELGKLTKPNLIELAQVLEIEFEGLVKNQLSFKILECLYEGDRLPENDCEWVKERLERDRAERLEKERLEREERLEKERLERERLERDRAERLEKERLELEKERLEREAEKEKLDREERERIRVYNLKIRE